MPAQTANLFLLQDLEDSSRTGRLADSDREALQAVAGWIKTFVVKPHEDLGRAGTVCPFVPGSLERKILWLAPEQITDPGEPDVIQLMNGYKRLLLETQPTSGGGADYEVIVVVFTDLPADRAQSVFDDVLQHLAVPSYADDGILFGPYYAGNEQTAIQAMRHHEGDAMKRQRRYPSSGTQLSEEAAMSATEDHSSHASGAVQQAPGLWRTDLQRQDRNEPEREVVQSRVDIGPRWCIRSRASRRRRSTPVTPDHLGAGDPRGEECRQRQRGRTRHRCRRERQAAPQAG